jgi:ribonucleoside-diphosphate reductase subunit M2
MQAASAIENLKMTSSPVKKINFEAADKENLPFDAETPIVDVQISKPIVEQVKPDQKTVTVAPTIKLEEVDEPLLQANPQRFVLFPIKYHEVRVMSTVVTRKEG